MGEQAQSAGKIQQGNQLDNILTSWGVDLQVILTSTLKKGLDISKLLPVSWWGSGSDNK